MKRYRVTWVTRLINGPFAWLGRSGLGASSGPLGDPPKPAEEPVDAGSMLELIAPGERRSGDEMSGTTTEESSR